MQEGSDAVALPDVVGLGVWVWLLADGDWLVLKDVSDIVKLND